VTFISSREQWKSPRGTLISPFMSRRTRLHVEAGEESGVFTLAFFDCSSINVRPGRTE